MSKTTGGLDSFQLGVIEGEGLAGKLLYSADIFNTKNKHREAALYEELQTVAFFPLIWQKQGLLPELLLWYVPRNTLLVGTSTP